MTSTRVHAVVEEYNNGVFDPVAVTGEKRALLVHGVAKGSIKVTLSYRQKYVCGLWFGECGMNGTFVHKQVL